MREPNFSSAGIVFGSRPGGLDVVKPPRFGLGRMAVLELGLPTVVLGEVRVFRLPINRSLVNGDREPCILTVYLFDSSRLLVACLARHRSCQSRSWRWTLRLQTSGLRPSLIACQPSHLSPMGQSHSRVRT